MQRQLIGSFGRVATYLEILEDGSEHFVLRATKGDKLLEERVLANSTEAGHFIEVGYRDSRCVPNTPTQLRDLLNQVRMWIGECAARTLVASPEAAKQDSLRRLRQRTDNLWEINFTEQRERDRQRLRDAWLVWDGAHRMWWKPGGFGRTEGLLYAGVYSEQEAKTHASGHPRDGVVAIPLSERLAQSSQPGSVLGLLRETGLDALGEPLSFKAKPLIERAQEALEAVLPPEQEPDLETVLRETQSELLETRKLLAEARKLAEGAHAGRGFPMERRDGKMWQLPLPWKR